MIYLKSNQSPPEESEQVIFKFKNKDDEIEYRIGYYSKSTDSYNASGCAGIPSPHVIGWRASKDLHNVLHNPPDESYENSSWIDTFEGYLSNPI